MHEPSESRLLWDAVRVTARLLEAADALVSGLEWRNHRRAPKKRARAIEYARDRTRRVQQNRELIALTRATLPYADQPARAVMASRGPDGRGATASRAPQLSSADRADHRTNRTSRPSWRHGRRQREDRQRVRAAPDIIIKGGREVQYGHKLNLTTGRSGLILDLGSRASIRRTATGSCPHRLLRRAPRQAAADGGFASRDNLAQAKALGVHDMAFHKKAACASSAWSRATGSTASCATSEPAYGPTSRAKRAYGLARCLWRELEHFAAYVW